MYRINFSSTVLCIYYNNWLLLFHLFWFFTLILIRSWHSCYKREIDFLLVLWDIVEITIFAYWVNRFTFNTCFDCLVNCILIYNCFTTISQVTVFSRFLTWTGGGWCMVWLKYFTFGCNSRVPQSSRQCLTWSWRFAVALI